VAKGEDLQRVGRAVAARRGELGMTQHDLADAAGVDLKTVYNLESGNRWPIARTRAAIAAALGWETGEFAAIAEARLASVPPPPPPSAEALIEAIRSKPMRQMGTRMAEEVDKRVPGLAGLATGAAWADPGTPVPSGAQVFGPGDNADLWDELVATGKRLAELRLTGPDGFDLEQMVQAMAMAMVQVDDSRRDRRGGAVAQLIRR
jgi:transcriptional regulator with XRE-family HTH domain